VDLLLDDVDSARQVGVIDGKRGQELYDLVLRTRGLRYRRLCERRAGHSGAEIRIHG